MDTQQPFTKSEKIEKLIWYLIIILLLIFGILYNIGPAREIIKKYFFPTGTKDEEILTVYLFLLAGTFLYLVFYFGRAVEKLNKNIESLKPNLDEKLFLKGTNGIYDDVDKEMTETRYAGQILHIDILGYTLFSVSPKLNEWKNKGKLRNMVLNLYHLSIEFVKNSPDIDSIWASQLTSYIEDINRFKTDQAKFMIKNKVKINLIPYSHIPAIHGFRLGNGSVYLSVAYWDEKLFIGPPHYQSVYIKILPSDSSRFASEIRQVFDNWVKKSQLSVHE